MEACVQPLITPVACREQLRLLPLCWEAAICLLLGAFLVVRKALECQILGGDVLASLNVLQNGRWTEPPGRLSYLQ